MSGKIPWLVSLIGSLATAELLLSHCRLRKLMATQRTMLQLLRGVKPGKMMEDGGQLLINSEAS